METPQSRKEMDCSRILECYEICGGKLLDTLQEVFPQKNNTEGVHSECSSRLV